MSGYLFFWLVPVAIIAAAVFGIWVIGEWADHTSVSPYDLAPGCATIAVIVAAVVAIMFYIVGAIAWRYLV